MVIIFCGQVFGDLKVTGIDKSIRGQDYYKCQCRCGNTKSIRGVHLRDGRSKSCGLCGYQNKYPEAHKSWDSMHQRCNNPNAPDYKHYGGRGIKVCKEWLRFIDFYDDMGSPPMDSITGNRWTLERKDTNGDYTKENCIWASAKDQNMNKTNTLHLGIKYYSNGNRRHAVK